MHNKKCMSLWNPKSVSVKESSWGAYNARWIKHNHSSSSWCEQKVIRGRINNMVTWASCPPNHKSHTLSYTHMCAPWRTPQTEAEWWPPSNKRPPMGGEEPHGWGLVNWLAQLWLHVCQYISITSTDWFYRAVWPQTEKKMCPLWAWLEIAEHLNRTEYLNIYLP